MTDTSLLNSLGNALAARQPFLEKEHQSGLRLFAGFYEGEPALVADLYAKTLLLTSHAETQPAAEAQLLEARQFYLSELPWIECVVQKQRNSKASELKRGKISFGSEPAREIIENSVHYALDLCLNQDASLYLDTRNLRGWLLENCRGSSVINSFAYTGSLGIAALAGGAERVVQIDLNAQFLELARRSAMLNRFDLGRMKLRAADFFSEVGRYKKEDQLFDLGLLDPPFFSVTEKGKVNLLTESSRLINKLRPLIKDGGRLISINNALFLSGKEYMHSLEALCQDGYLEIESLIPVPEEFTGYPQTITATMPVDPAPFNHPTKIAVLRVHRKDGRNA